MKVFIASSLLLSSALAAVVPVAPGYAPAPAPYHPAPAPYHEEKLPPQPFAYEYGGADAYGRHFAKTETQDEYGVVQGEYRVELPDGRVQIVSYHADHDNGFIADVRYEGEAHPEPAYKPAPAPHHAPHHVAPLVAPVAHHAVHPVPVAHHAVHPVPVAHHAVHPVPVAHHAVHAAPVLPHHAAVVG